MMDPLPMMSALKQSNVQIRKLQGSEQSTTCADPHARVDRWVICFEGSHGLLASVFTKGYSAESRNSAKSASPAGLVPIPSQAPNLRLASRN